MKFVLTVTPEQMQQIEALNAVWDTLTTAEGLRRYDEILGRRGTALILRAARCGAKVTTNVVEETKQ